MNLIAVAFALAVGTCPRFVEILPDPSDVEDARGEFVEIRLPHAPLRNTVSVYHEEKKVWEGIAPESADRILLIRDTSLCPDVPILCKSLVGSALPNSRKAVWRLWSGSCEDVAELPVPKSGYSFVRRDSAFDAWEFSLPTPGLPDGNFESGVNDCRLRIDSLFVEASVWKGEWTLLGCDSARVRASFRSESSLSENAWAGTLERNVRSRFDTRLSAKALEIVAAWPPDDIPGNDTFDTLVAIAGNFPLRFSEVHPCPEEGVPEWIEIYHGGLRDISLSGMRLCGNRNAKLPDVKIGSRESIVLSKDTLGMRSFVGNDDVRILAVNFGYLKNGSDSLYLCYGNEKVDSVVWGKFARIQTHCPAGFSTATGRKENSPGFQTPGSLASGAVGELPFQVEWNARVFSRKNRENPLMIRVQGGEGVLVELISGNGNLLWKKTLAADTDGNRWIEIPLLDRGFPGPNFLRISQGNSEKRIGVILRP